MKEKPKLRRLYTPDEARQALGVSLQTLRRYAKAGLIDSLKTPGGQNRYDVEAYIEKMMSKGIDAGANHP